MALFKKGGALKGDPNLENYLHGHGLGFRVCDSEAKTWHKLQLGKPSRSAPALIFDRAGKP